jgi:hypothetical protein
MLYYSVTMANVYNMCLPLTRICDNLMGKFVCYVPTHVQILICQVQMKSLFHHLARTTAGPLYVAKIRGK